MEKKSYYAIIPAKVRYCSELSSGSKLLYGEITALCNEKGYCWASNKYFSDLYEVDERTIRRWISSLESNRFVKVEIIRVDRRIYLMDDLTFEECDEDGNPKPKKEKKAPKQRKDVIAKKIHKWFAAKCEKELKSKPVMDAKSYYSILRAMNQGGLTEHQIVDLIDEWFMTGKSPEDMISVSKALSNDQISRYKSRHHIK